MLTYFLLLAYPCIFALLSARGRISSQRRIILPIIGFGLFYNFISVIRDNVAGDWYTYEQMTYLFNFMTLGQAMGDTDPGFGLVGWLGMKLGGGLYSVNLFCSAIISLGVCRLACWVATYFLCEKTRMSVRWLRA